MDQLPAGQFYAYLTALFDQAAGQPAPLVFSLDIGPCRARVRCTSPLLAQRLRRPLAHLPGCAGDSPPHFSLDAVDIAAGPHAMPVLPWPAQHTSPEQQTAEYHQDPYLFTTHGNAVLTGLSYAENRTIAVVRDAEHWPLEHYKQAVFISLYQHLRRHGLFLVHASAIARHGRAVLISGSSGAGKTTTMLTCVRAGFDFISDDTTLVRRLADGRFQAVSLLSTLNVTPQTLEWFPELAPHVSRRANAVGKRLAMIHEVYPERMALEAEVVAILVPEIVGAAASRLDPAGKPGMLSDMLPYSLDLHSAEAARSQLDFLAELLEGLPGHRLSLGRDRHDLPHILSTLLRSA